MGFPDNLVEPAVFAEGEDSKYL